MSLTGTGFSPGMSAYLGGTAATSLSVTSATTLTFTAPAHAAGWTSLVLMGPGGTASLANAFEYKDPAPPTPDLAPPKIEKHGVAPNPNGGSGWVALKLSGFADELVVKVYTKGWTLVGASRCGPRGPGWHRLPLPSELAAQSSGLYYYSAKAWRDGGPGPGSTVGSFLVIR